MRRTVKAVFNIEIVFDGVKRFATRNKENMFLIKGNVYVRANSVLEFEGKKYGVNAVAFYDNAVAIETRED